MSGTDDVVRELERRLRTRGRARRRLLAECRDHLADAAAQHGEREAVRRFGSPAELAAAFDLEVATGRAQVSTAVSVAAVFVTAGSTLALLHAASHTAAAVPAWAVVFLAAAQTAAVAVALAVQQGVRVHRGAATAPDLALLARRNTVALACAATTLLAAAGALPGHASVTGLLAGPLAVALAAAAVLRTRRPARHLAGYRERVVRPPVPHLAPARLLAVTAAGATVAAFVRDRGEHDSVAGALIVGGVELALVVAGFAVLGPVLGLRGRLARR